MKHFHFHKFFDKTLVPSAQLWAEQCKSTTALTVWHWLNTRGFNNSDISSRIWRKTKNNKRPKFLMKGMFPTDIKGQGRWLGGWTLISCKQTDCSYSPALHSYQRELCHNLNNLWGLNYCLFLYFHLHFLLSRKVFQSNQSQAFEKHFLNVIHLNIEVVKIFALKSFSYGTKKIPRNYCTLIHFRTTMNSWCLLVL